MTADPWTLVDQARAGDRAAFAELYDRYRDEVRRYIYWRVRSHDLADDLTQDVFANALRAIGTLRWHGVDPGAWFITIARNRIFDHYKSARVRLAASIPLEWFRDDDPGAGQTDPDPQPDDAAATADVRATVRAAIEQLPPKQRIAIELRYLADLTVEETCARTGWTEGVVKALTYRAVRRLGRLIPRESVEAAA